MEIPALGGLSATYRAAICWGRDAL